MKKFEFEDEATAAATKVWGEGTWWVRENDDATFSVEPPGLTGCPAHLRLQVGDKGRLQNLFGIYSYVVVEFGSNLYRNITN